MTDAPRESLVLVHGLGSSASFWENLLPDLAPRYRVVTPDLPGHGPGAARPTMARAHPRELAADLMERLRADGVDSPHLVGLSLGGWVVLEMAALGFGRSVVALAPAGLWVAGQKIAAERWTSFIRPGLPPLAPALPALIRVPLVKRAVLRSLVREPGRVSDGQLLAAAIALGQAKGYRACDRAAVRNRFTGGAKLEVPTAVAFGDDDRILPPGTSQNRDLLSPSTEFTIVAGCGHAMSWDRPDACLGLIERTAARVPRSAP